VLLLLLLLLTAAHPMPWSRLVFRRRHPVKELVDAPKSSVDQRCDPRLQARPHPRPSHLIEHLLEMLFIPSGLPP
jgi:hypothetical protein